MSAFNNLDFLSVGITVAAIGLLGFIVYFSNRKSVTSKAFLFFSLATIAYGIFNYASYQAPTAETALWLTRLVIFTATWHAFSLFQLFYVFPKEGVQFPKNYFRLLVPLVSIVSIFTLSPYVFSGLEHFSRADHMVIVHREAGTLLFALMSGALVFSSIWSLIKKTRQAGKEEKTQFKLVSWGTLISFSLIITFNLILPAGFNNVRFIPLAALNMLPFVGFTFYAITKYRLLKAKVIATETVIFVLSVVSLIDVIASHDITTLILRSSIFLLILIFGIILDKSVRREIEQREQLQILTKELGEANEQLKALDKARAEFISIASHQLRTPPATIKWFLAALLSGDYGQMGEEVKKVVEKAQRTNNSQISLIEDLLNVSRIERGKMEFLFEPVDILLLADLTFEQLQPIAKEKKLEFLFNKPPTPLPQIMADREKLRQVMNNIIDNSIKYTKQGSILVELFQEGGNIRFQVTDTGKGMGKQEQGAIFQKYSRGKESIVHSAGLGLGLYVAKVIIEQHKGKIWAESKGEGKGSTFIFTIPIQNELKATTLLDLTQDAQPAIKPA